MSRFDIGSCTIGAGRAFVIAEVAQAHDGSLGLAHAFIDAAAAAGTDAIKFQTHIAAAESTRDETFRVKFSHQDATRYDYWKRMEFTPDQWRGLAAHAADRKLVFLSSAFSVEAVALLDSLGMAAWKIASGELGSEASLDAMLKSGAPFIVSSGMSPWTEIDEIVGRIRNCDRSLALLQCTSRYPTALEAVGLNVMDEMRRRFQLPVGLSDHSGKTAPALAALARGADVLELHITLDRAMFGPDVSSSLTAEEFRQVCDFRDAVTLMNANPVDKDKAAAELAPMRAMFTRSLAACRPLPANTVLAAGMLTTKKPGTGIPESKLASLVGRRLVRDVEPDRLLRWEDLE